MRHLPAAGAAAAVASMLLAAPAGAASGPTALPTVKRSLSAAASVRRACPAAPARTARGVAVSAYRAPITGFATVRMAGSDRSDWDLVVRDAASGRVLSASQGFGSHEVAQNWVAAGQRLRVEGCRRKGTARSVPVSIALVVATPPKSPGTPSLVRVYGNDRAKLAKLEASGIDVTEDRHAAWTDVVVAGAAQLAALDRLGLRHSTVIADLDRSAARARAADARYAARVAASPIPSGRTGYRDYADYQAELKALAERYPDRVRPVVIGHSFQGRELAGLEIADGVRGHDGRPVYLVVAMHHAREWPSSEAAMEYATMLATGAGGNGDPRVADLRRRERTFVVPLINPDGFISTRDSEGIDPADQARPFVGEPDGGTGLPPSTVESVLPPGGVLSYRRKNCDGEFPNPNVPCALQWGVDPNRNYGELWGGSGASPDPTSQSYHGPGPWSEPETQAVHEFSQAHQVTALITLHNVAALVLRPPGLHDNGLAPDEPRLKAIGDAMGAATGYTSEYGYQLYDTAGTTEDWNYAAQGTYGYTIEIGPAGGSFHMPYETGFVNEWTGNTDATHHNGKGLRDALLIAGEAAASPADHGVITGRAPAGRTLRVRKTFPTKTSPFCQLGVDPVVNVLGGPQCLSGEQGPQTINDRLDTTTVVPTSGRFAWHVGPSTRPFLRPRTVTHLATASSRTDRFTSSTQTLPTDATGSPTYEDHPFTLTPADAAKLLKLRLEWPTPEDYDLELYKRNGSTLEKVTSSGNPPGTAEEINVPDPAPGDYVLRVVDFAAVSGTWTATVERFPGVTESIPGTTESWTLTCEDGGRVVATRQVTIDRGQVVRVDPCRAPRQRR